MLQQVVNVLVLASIYSLFGVGFTLILGSLDILNLAHGAILTAGAFVAFYIASAGVPLWIATLAALAAAGLLSIVVNEVALAPLRRRGGRGLIPLVSSLGAMTVIVTAIQLVSRAQVVRLPAGSFPDVVWHVASVSISLTQAAVIVVAALSVVFAYLILNRTKFGRAVKATQFDELGAKLVGVPIESTIRYTFLLAGVMAGIAGVGAALLFNSVQFEMGNNYLLKGFVVVVLGGFGSVTGTMVASVLVAFLEVASVVVGLSQWRDAIVFGLLIVILLSRPKGLFASPENKWA